jgi:SNF2 family DNA or RNA helicase
MSTEALVTAVKGAREARMLEISRDEGDFFHSLETQGLKAHQLEGVLWMSAMYDCGCSFILGDEMGMGKTVQVLL